MNCRTFSLSIVAGSLLVALITASLPAAEHRIEPLDETAPKDKLSDEVFARLMDKGIKVIRGASRTVCEIWPCKQWDAQAADFTATSEVLYPFQPGSLVGVIRFPRRGNDFRDQRMDSGVYTLRYAQQPVDGNHEGTSITRDFLMMVKAEEDTSVEPMDNEKLMEAAAEATGASHPAMLSLKKVSDASSSIRHEESEDWWIAHIKGKAKAGESTKDMTIALVVAGHADE